MSEWLWIDGEFRGADEPVLPADLLGVQHGLSLFETMGVWGGRIPFWSWHGARLQRAAEELGLGTVQITELCDEAEALLQKNGHPDGILRLTLYPGAERLHWVLQTRARRPRPQPLVLHGADLRRGLADSSARFKSGSRLLYHMASMEAERAGADEALILGDQDQVLETVYGNLFFERGQALCTPAENGAFLPGVGRALLLQWFSTQMPHQRVRVEDFNLGDLAQAERLWVVNSVHGPCPAVLPKICADVGQGDDPLRTAWDAVLRNAGVA